MRDLRQAPAALYPGNDLVPIVQEAGWAPGSIWTGAENLAYTGIRSPDRPARSQSLYRLSYRGPNQAIKFDVTVHRNFCDISFHFCFILNESLPCKWVMFRKLLSPTVHSAAQ